MNFAQGLEFLRKSVETRFQQMKRWLNRYGLSRTFLTEEHFKPREKMGKMDQENCINSENNR